MLVEETFHCDTEGLASRNRICCRSTKSKLIPGLRRQLILVIPIFARGVKRFAYFACWCIIYLKHPNLCRDILQWTPQQHKN